MARRKRKINPDMVKYLKIGIVGVVAVFVGILIFKGVRGAMAQSSFFIIKEVEVAPSLEAVHSRYLTRLKGKNIFQVNLKDLQKRIQAQYSDIDRLRILRKFPDKIYVDAKRRAPFASVRIQGQEMVVDEKGTVLAVNPSSSFYKGVFSRAKLPNVIGVPSGRQGMVGKTLLYREVREALRVIKIMQKNEYLQAYKIKSVDVQNLSEMSVYLSNGLQIILDKDKVIEKVKKLGILLSQGEIDFKKTGYVDLRFKEPVLGIK